MNPWGGPEAMPKAGARSELSLNFRFRIFLEKGSEFVQKAQPHCMNQTKKIIYIASFAFLGVLLTTALHGLLEMLYIRLLTSDFQNYSLGFSWSQWFEIHKYFSIVLLIAGIVLGYQQGKHWWNVIYVQKRYG
ncbi:MAG: hypothetical protein A3K05_04455 [Candidatus Doudnabacteria bacterium RIFCSPHIGHO2_01_48_18]|nr:MAG: hypothetical protein A3K05_04455 [Candidatus Doudnabacteria bacterium RIFCSPHIGHO2_01_48_18]